jgi:hypothetical protein
MLTCEERLLCANPSQWSSSGSQLDPEQNRGYGPVATTGTYRLRGFTCEWLTNAKYSDYQLLFTTQDEWTIVKYVTDVLRPFQYWALWMLKRHTVTLHFIITVHNDMFDHLDGVMRALAKKKTQWKDDLFFAVKCARQNLSK